jgi:hypothetical protein
VQKPLPLTDPPDNDSTISATDISNASDAKTPQMTMVPQKWWITFGK